MARRKTAPASPHYGQASDVGCVREVNEDDFGCFIQGARRLFVVADGMGGESGGRVASQTAVKAARLAFEGAAALAPADVLRGCVEAANRACLDAQRQNPELSTMGTTLELLLIENGSAWWAHVGDSRIYRIANGRAERLTKDHTRVQQMLDDGLITAEVAAEHPQRNVLSRVVGRVDESAPDVSPGPIATSARDAFLLCTDGMTDLIRDEELAWIVSREDPNGACKRLVALARRRGAPDNVTVQVVAMGTPRGAVASAFRRARSPLSPAARRTVRRQAVRAAWALVVIAALTGAWFYAVRPSVRWWRAPASAAAAVVTPTTTPAPDAAKAPTGQGTDPGAQQPAPPAPPEQPGAAVPAKPIQVPAGAGPGRGSGGAR